MNDRESSSTVRVVEGIDTEVETGRIGGHTKAMDSRE